MAKETCKKCGKEIGLVAQVKLKDKSFICRDCYKKAGSVFHNIDYTYDEYEQLMKEQERNGAIFEQVIKKGKIKRKEFFGQGKVSIGCYEGCGLIVVSKQIAGFACFGVKKVHNIYRYADLQSYNHESGVPTTSHFMEMGKSYSVLSFAGDYAVPTIYLETDDASHRRLTKYFNDCFGVGTGGLKGFKERAKQQAAAVSAVASSIKSAASGDKEEAVQHLAEGASAALLGNREKWIDALNSALDKAGLKWEL